MRRYLLGTALLLLPTCLLAEDAALVFGTDRYERLGRISRGADVVDAASGLEGLGFQVFSLSNARSGTGADRLAEFLDVVEDADRLVVVLSGRFVTDGTRSWYLYADATEPELFGLGEAALSLDSVMRVLADRQGQAILMLAEPDGGAPRMADGYLQAGVGPLDPPQGVTVLRAEPREAAAFLGDQMVRPEADLAALLRAAPDIRAEGYLPQRLVFMPGPVEIEDAPAPTGPSEADLNAEARMWDRTTDTDTVEAYRAYIRAYPQGRFVDVAEETISAILSEPNRSARLAEEALRLSATQRRAVQADLTLLGYNTRGVDGIFGPGTRSAITNWQQTNGYPQSGYVTQDQVNRINAQAERRRAEQAAEEARAEAEAERLDREFWAETGARGDEPGYRAYLRRFPDGLFSDVAQRRLDAIEAERTEAAEIADRSAWGRAAATDTVASYEAYLAAWPEGVFASEATSRIEAMQPSTTPDEDDAVAVARRHEETLGLSGVRAQLLELRLRDLGFNPGPIDGVIDEATRTALRAYQDGAGLTATGYVDQRTLIQLMAGALNR